MVGKEKILIEVLSGDLLDAAARILRANLVSGARIARIVEVEAYGTEPGSHAHRGMTPRNAAMFGPPGLAYNYLNYGVHWLLNITATPVGQPGAILIRAAQPLAGIDEMQASRPSASRAADLLSGPGKLTQAMGIGPDHRGLNLAEGGSIRIELSDTPCPQIVASRRIGLALGKGDQLPWRFLDGEARAWWSAPVR